MNMPTKDDMTLKSILQFIKDFRMLLGFIAVFFTALNFGSSFVSAQLSLPSKVAENTTAIGALKTVDTILARRIQINRDSAVAEWSTVRPQIELLLRLNCPRTATPDLIRECRDFLDRRPPR